MSILCIPITIAISDWSMGKAGSCCSSLVQNQSDANKSCAASCCQHPQDCGISEILVFCMITWNNVKHPIFSNTFKGLKRRLHFQCLSSAQMPIAINTIHGGMYQLVFQWVSLHESAVCWMNVNPPMGVSLVWCLKIWPKAQLTGRRSVAQLKLGWPEARSSPRICGPTYPSRWPILYSEQWWLQSCQLASLRYLQLRVSDRLLWH